MKKLRGADDSGTRRYLTATERLRELARIAGDLGADEVVHDAVALAERSDATPELMDAAIARYADRMIFEIDERRAALMRPKALSGSHAAQMRSAILDAQQWLRDAASEADAVEEPLREERERFLAEINDTSLRPTKNRREAIEHANAVAAERVTSWAASMGRRMRALHHAALERYVATLQSLIGKIRAAGVPIENDLPADSSYTAPTFEPHTVSPPFKWRRPRVGDESRAILHEAATVGSQRVLDAFHEAVTLARRRLEWDVALRLRATADALKRASDVATAAQAEGAHAIANELNRIDELAKRLGKL